MIIKTSQQSLLDYLFTIMPERREKSRNIPIEKLYEVWKNSTCKNDYIVRTSSISSDDIEKMTSSQLVVKVGDRLELTEKGKKAIAVMILGSENSIFDEEENKSYGESLNYTQNVSLLTANKKAENDWWGRYFDNN